VKYIDLTSFNNTLTNVVAPNLTTATTKVGFAYFVFNTTNITIGVGSYEEDETPSIYLAINNVPSNMSYLVKNDNTSEPAHLIQLQAPEPNTQAVNSWYLAVNASSDYSLWVNYPCAVNCSGDGTCNPASGICNCFDSYEKFDCSSKAFSLVWIILIAIGGAVVLAFAIAIPVMCYLRKKREEQDYTRI